MRSFKTKDLKPFRMRSYRKTGVGEGVPLLVAPEQFLRGAGPSSLLTTHYSLEAIS